MVPVFDRRKLRPLILALAIALCAFQLTTCTGMWLLDPLIVRATHVGLVLSMLFLWRSSNRALRKNPRPEPAWSFLFDILMIAMSAGAAAYIITNFSYIQDRHGICSGVPGSSSPSLRPPGAWRASPL